MWIGTRHIHLSHLLVGFLGAWLGWPWGWAVALDYLLILVPTNGLFPNLVLI
jgi:hypothetical protein